MFLEDTHVFMYHIHELVRDIMTSLASSVLLYADRSLLVCSLNLAFIIYLSIPAFIFPPSLSILFL